MVELVEKLALDPARQETLVAAEAVPVVKIQPLAPVDSRFNPHHQAEVLAMLERRQYLPMAEEAAVVPVVQEMGLRLEAEFLPRLALEHLPLEEADLTYPCLKREVRQMPQATRAMEARGMTAGKAETEEAAWFVFVTNSNNGSLFQIRGD